MTSTACSALAGYVRRLAERDAHGLSDRELLDRFTRQRDEAAFTELVRRHGPMVLAACRRVLRHVHDAEDAFQAAFLVLARKADSIRQRDSVSGWLYQVAYRVALRARMADDRRREQHTALSDGFPAPEPRCPCVVEELEGLPEPYRAAVVLCYLEGRTQAEAARLLATTASAVNSRLRRARDLLRRRLARRGLALAGVAVAETLTAGAAPAALPAAFARLTARAALDFAIQRAPAGGASALAVALAKGALHSMVTAKAKIVVATLALIITLLPSAALLVPTSALGDDPPAAAARAGGARPQATEHPAPRPDAKLKPRRSVILLWMSGGPSQIDTFDPKSADPNGALFKAIDTDVKGVQISTTLPRLAKLTSQLTLIRSLTHGEGDHVRGTYLMRTGHAPGGAFDYPSLASVLAKELGDPRPEVPRYLSIAPLRGPFGPAGPGFLSQRYAPLIVGSGDGFGAAPPAGEALRLPPAEAFDALARGRGEAHRKAVAKAFDLGEEKPAVRDSYGRGLFGQGCLLARRLVEAGVPVVEVTLPGWDTHANVPALLPALCDQLDAGMAALLKDLKERKRLDSTLVVWMGEFGRTPRINLNQGRDHWPNSFTVVLAGAGTKGGRVIGKTSADGVRIEERPVTPPELLATIYQALGIDSAKENRTPTGEQVPLVPARTRAVKEALR
jgi:DNA-directed RNA polymerase specialized sigma24 family protein